MQVVFGAKMTMQQLLKAFWLKMNIKTYLTWAFRIIARGFFSSFQSLGAPLPQVFNCYIPVRQK
ncbi:MAG: hypothetical protein Q4A13_09535, partial [Fretibacterium sp.]|nr:hypothetical protein [Fretibacterium sp.]